MALWFSVPGLAANQSSAQVQVPGGQYLFIVRRDTGAQNPDGSLQINNDTTTTLQQLRDDGVTWDTIATVSNQNMQNGQGVAGCAVNPAGGPCQIVGGSQGIVWAGVADPDSRTNW
jgi:hypothetical protein